MLTALVVHLFRVNGAYPPPKWCIEHASCILGLHRKM